MEKTTRIILTVFFVSLFSLTAVQFYLQKSFPSVLGTTDVQGCYLLKGYCSTSTRCPSTYDTYFNPAGFIDCKQNACCVKKSSYSPLSSSPTPTRATAVPTPTPATSSNRVYVDTTKLCNNDPELSITESIQGKNIWEVIIDKNSGKKVIHGFGADMLGSTYIIRASEGGLVFRGIRVGGEYQAEIPIHVNGGNYQLRFYSSIPYTIGMPDLTEDKLVYTYPFALNCSVSTPTPTLVQPDYSMKVAPFWRDPYADIIYSYNVNGNNPPRAGNMLGTNCWYRRKIPGGTWSEWTIANPQESLYTSNTNYQDVRYCTYSPSQEEKTTGTIFEFAGGVTVFHDLNGNGKLDSNEPGYNCAGIDSTRNGNNCQSRRSQFVYIPSTPIPTPYLPIESFSVSSPCSRENIFKNASYRCSSGRSGSLGDSSSCKQIMVWYTQVLELCRYSQPTPTSH